MVVYPEETVTDIDGNTRTRPSKVGVPCMAVIQTNTLMTGSEDQSVGFATEEQLRLRLVNYPGGELGAQSQIVWNGKRYALHGEPRRFNSSPRTAHVDYTIKRY
ncbi:hypothetical protein ACFYY5_01370 [Nocardia elegans]|uniref:Head-to-tail stopper n=1 Tax=Nocardia elegans TaxID=300029 RepID=A0ABW6T5P2_9NOCA